MPYNKESGKKYDSPEEALADALPEGVDASEVMNKLKEMQYDLVPAMGAVGVSIEMESEEMPEASEEKSEEESEEESEEKSEEESGGDKEVEVSMGVMGMEEPISKKRDKVADKLMDKFKKGMV
tara:strand:+ start:7201 stop:7572 length:372 start_codon:yes stop_codon:yes gene_type:complete